MSRARSLALGALLLAGCASGSSTAPTTTAAATSCGPETAVTNAIGFPDTRVTGTADCTGLEIATALDDGATTKARQICEAGSPVAFQKQVRTLLVRAKSGRVLATATKGGSCTATT